MSAPSTAEDPAARTSRAVATATAAGRDLGLTVRDPEVLHDLFSVVVHLAPSPVVVRVPTVLPRLFRDDLSAQAAQQRVELDVAGWLADQRHPVIAPSPLVPCEPVCRDGFSMTFWQYVTRDDTVETDDVRDIDMTAGLHAVLRDYPGELPFLSSVDGTIPESFGDLETRPDLLGSADLDRAWREWAVLEPVLGSRAGFEAAFPGIDVQPVHGDAPWYNLVPTPGGVLHSDFERTTLGPIEQDLGLVGPEGVAAYDAAAARLGLRPPDTRVLRVVESMGMLQVVACLALVPQLPMLREALNPLLEYWRASPFAGGLS